MHRPKQSKVSALTEASPTGLAMGVTLDVPHKLSPSHVLGSPPVSAGCSALGDQCRARGWSRNESTRLSFSLSVPGERHWNQSGLSDKLAVKSSTCSLVLMLLPWDQAGRLLMCVHSWLWGCGALVTGLNSARQQQASLATEAQMTK